MDRQRNQEVVRDRSIGIDGIWSNSSFKHSLIQQNSVSSKDRTQEISFGGEYETIESISDYCKLQIRGSISDVEIDSTKLVDDLNGSERRLLSCEFGKRKQEVVGNSLEKSLDELQSPSIWSQPLSIHLHKSDQRSDQLLEKQRNLCSCLSERFSDNCCFKKDVVEV